MFGGLRGTGGPEVESRLASLGGGGGGGCFLVGDVTINSCKNESSSIVPLISDS